MRPNSTQRVWTEDTKRSPQFRYTEVSLTGFSEHFTSRPYFALGFETVSNACNKWTHMLSSVLLVRNIHSLGRGRATFPSVSCTLRQKI